MLRLTHVPGSASDPEIADVLHAREHHGKVDHISLDPADTTRMRLCATTGAGKECVMQDCIDRPLTHLEIGRTRVMEDG